MEVATCFLCDSNAAVPEESFKCGRCGAALNFADGVFVPRRAVASEHSYPHEASAQIGTLEDKSFWFQHRNEVILAMVRRWPPSGPILDVGAGNGFVARHMDANGFKTVIVEPSPDGVSLARGRGATRVIRGRLAEIGCSASLHAVSLFDVLEHLSEPEALLRDVAAVLRSDGMVYVTVPAHRWLWSAADDYAGHKIRHSRRSLRESFGRAGFECVWATHFFPALTVPVFVLRSLPTRLGFRRDEGVRSWEFVLPGPLHAIIRGLSRLESQLVRRIPIPVGTSIAAVFRKRQQSKD